jgi:peptide-methionine (S)-S-oxide reductase
MSKPGAEAPVFVSYRGVRSRLTGVLRRLHSPFELRISFDDWGCVIPIKSLDVPTRYDSRMSALTTQGRDHWQFRRRRLRFWFWVYLLIALFGSLYFIHSFQTRDPYVFAILIAIPLFALRQAWRMDRQIVQCDSHLFLPIIQTKQGETMTEKATFAAGCFWGVEEMFRQTPGVQSTRVGYIGGKTLNPTYEQVCTDRTGHAEAVEIEFDPAVVTYQHLLDLFFENHDPTTLNRQGPDRGSQYRSGVFYHSPEQQKAAETEVEKRDASGDYAHPLVTEVVPAGKFYSAEEYHQQYFARRGANWSCHFGNGKKPGRANAAAHKS